MLQQAKLDKMEQKKLTYLDRNEFNYGPADIIGNVLKNYDPNTLCFYTRIYDQGKKSIFSEYLSELYDIDEKQILLGYGGEDILKQAVHFFLTEDENKTMMLPKFSWWYYKSIADEVKGQSIQYPLYEEGNTYKYDFKAMERMVKEHNPKVVLMASPNNPTGNMLTPSELEKTLSFIDPNTIVIIDEAYASFAKNDNSYIKPLIENHPNVLVVRTLSKFYGMPGLRLGFAFAGLKVCEHFLRYSTKYLGYNRLSEELGIAVLKATDYYQHVADQMQAEREAFYAQIRPLPGFKVYDSYANFILIKYPIELKDEIKRQLLDAGYQIKFMNEPDIDKHLRITLGTPKQNQDVRDVIIRVAKNSKL